MIKETITELISTAAENLGYLVYESSIYLKGENSKITVKIDSKKEVSHEDCDTYSKELSNLLDDSAVLPNYLLEISSPGINRKLRGIEEFKRFKGAPAKIVFEKDDERETIKGIITEVSPRLITLTSGNKDITISYNEIVKANLDY
ncbi:MAG: hypothetical protein GY754_16900 [bacterium]|nr:hypothetical protein [bacterium]